MPLIGYLYVLFPTNLPHDCLSALVTKKEVRRERKRGEIWASRHSAPSLLPTSLETLSHTLPPTSPELPTAICYKNFSVGPHVVWFLKSYSPFLTWSEGYWVVTGPLNDGRKIRHCRQCKVLINSVLSGPCTVVRAALYNCRFDATVNTLALAHSRDARFWISLSPFLYRVLENWNLFAIKDDWLTWSAVRAALLSDSDMIRYWPVVVSLQLSSSSFTPLRFASAKRQEKEPLPFDWGWLMPELFSPHFIWWSSVSSPPLSITRRGRSPSTTATFFLSLPLSLAHFHPPFLLLSLPSPPRQAVL